MLRAVRPYSRASEIRESPPAARPRLSASPADRIHPGCRREGDNDGELAGLAR